METIKVMVNGAPGNVARTVIRRIIQDPRFALVPYSLTGPEINEKICNVDDVAVQLFLPEARSQALAAVRAAGPEVICIDFTHPAAVNENAEFYCEGGLPFVMGTTGGDRERLMARVAASNISAVIAPNMAKQIVGFQAMMAYAAETFPGLFAGYSLDIRESHQQGKADTSGTAKAMVGYFNRLGCTFTEADIVKERDPQRQKTVWGIPEAHLAGHAWHTYTLVSDDETVKFSFTHNVNGREVYVKGTLDAVVYLHCRMRDGIRGRVFSMIDVLKGD
ncbi:MULTISPECIES: dihydrodipicolinate reductase [Desulfococcus]|uniref:4-hydroxy-tetrahydrodipicolinate reductase n=1 Tax=Desulfococcus multivorans DSM 2059 TaxID=1121405 RepID=S7ULJ5_DESML|nr:dihydrodipicolinate reductase [Desulfococcus multivorans]AOY59728.1 DapB: dihydrodipicolinate reductase [Desulfococcus multivorans]AQV01901.1 dihydrodipicolinate reductase [Desulfococcus multivorans]EPR33213.1 dihydrodipicolinate reductase [Desulfococcus multivorans DSM 2059]SKA23744.1 4-hydroxy-tetrahydrodipicolinate reductase [Desulfococcus multivorans DSM 2059]